MLKRDGILLRPISKDDVDFILNLRNDIEIASEFFSDPPLYDFIHEKWLQSQNDTMLDFIIESNGKKIGRIYVYNISYRHQNGQFGIVLTKEGRGKGFAVESSKLLFDYIFNNLPISKIYLYVFSDNSNAFRLYEKLGFEKEGLFKKEYFKNGEWRDVLRMALFKEKWLCKE